MGKRCSLFYLPFFLIFLSILPPFELAAHPLDISYTTLIPKSAGFQGATFIHPYELNLLGTSQEINIHTEKDVELLNEILMPYFRDNFRVFANKKLIELQNIKLEKKSLAEILADGVYLKFFIPRIAGQQHYEFQVTLFNSYFSTQSNKVLLLDSLGKVVPGRPEVHFTPKRQSWMLNLKAPDFSADIDDGVDSDKDGLSDHLENLYGMNAHDVDTDKDQFSDFDEYIMGWPPLDNKPCKGQKIMYLDLMDALNSASKNPLVLSDSARYYSSDEPIVFPLKISKDSVVKKITQAGTTHLANSSLEQISRFCFALVPNLNADNSTTNSNLKWLFLGLFFLLGVIHVTRRNIPNHPLLYHLFEFKMKKQRLLQIILSYAIIYMVDIVLAGVIFWAFSSTFTIDSWLIFIQVASLAALFLLVFFNLIRFLLKLLVFKNKKIRKEKSDILKSSVSTTTNTYGNILMKSIAPFSCKWIMVFFLAGTGAFHLFRVSLLVYMVSIVLSLLFYTIGVRLFYHRIQYYFRTVGICAIMITGVMTFLLLLAFLFPPA